MIHMIGYKIDFLKSVFKIIISLLIIKKIVYKKNLYNWNIHELSDVNAAMYVDFGSYVRLTTFKGTLHVIARVKIFQTVICCWDAATTRWQASCLPNSIRLL